MQIPRRGGFGFPPGAQSTRFWRRPAAVLPTRGGPFPGAVCPAAPPSRPGPGSCSGRRPACPHVGALRSRGRRGGRQVVPTKCLWSDFDSSDDARGVDSEGLPPAGTPSTASLASVGLVRARVRGMHARWLAISRRGWPQIRSTTPSTSGPGPCRHSWLRRAAPLHVVTPRSYCQAAPAWLPCRPAGYRRVTVLPDTGATHCFICARLVAALGLPPSTHAGLTSVTTAAPGELPSTRRGGAPKRGRRTCRRRAPAARWIWMLATT